MTTDTMPLGRVKAPGDDPHTFLFITPDVDRLRQGEFITYQMEIEGAERTVLARITDRRAIRLYPGSFLADPEIDPQIVSSTVGYSGNNSNLSELTAEIIGYFDSGFNDFMNPRIPPPTGTPLYLADSAYLAKVLSRAEQNRIGSATMGWLSSRQAESVPITIDVDAVTSTHLAIIASTGAGKSYTASVLVEEMLHAKNRAAVLVIDPHGEYSTLNEISNKDEFADGSYRPDVTVSQPGTTKIRVGTLELGELRYLLPSLSDRMSYVLGLAYRRVRQNSRYEHQDETYWTVDDLVQVLDEMSNDEDNDYRASAGALVWRVRSVIQTGKERVFDNSQQTKLNTLIRPGQCTVMQLNQIDPREQQLIVATLMRRLYYARLRTERGDVDEGDDYYLPYPVFVLIEEAHNYAPANANIISTDVLKQVLSEGRKFGVGVGLISQRPGKLDSDVLSQCNTQFLLRIVNPVDQARVAESVESVGRDLLKELPALNKGQAIISGVAVNTPVICQIRRRITPHGGEGSKASEAWQSWFNQANSDQRNRDEAMPRNRTRN